MLLVHSKFCSVLFFLIRFHDISGVKIMGTGEGHENKLNLKSFFSKYWRRIMHLFLDINLLCFRMCVWGFFALCFHDWFFRVFNPFTSHSPSLVVTKAKAVECCVSSVWRAAKCLGFGWYLCLCFCVCVWFWGFFGGFSVCLFFSEHLFQPVQI